MQKPFHESVVDILEKIEPSDRQSLQTIGELLKLTKLPKDHDTVSAAWMRRASAHAEDRPGDNSAISWDWFEEVNASILEQKKPVVVQEEKPPGSLEPDSGQGPGPTGTMC